MSRRDKTIGHIHIDPKFINQTNCSSTLEIGQIVYLDTDGDYKPAQAVSGKTNVAGVVWEFEGDHAMYIMQGDTPCMYRYPLTPEFFLTDGSGRPNKLSPNPIKIPGDLGDKLYLSATTPGYYTDVPPAIEIGIGKKMPYGFLYQPLNSCPEIQKVTIGSGPQVSDIELSCTGNLMTLTVYKSACCS